jgi:hypothetical protein
LDELAQRIAAERRAKALVNKLHEFLPGGCAAVALNQSVPLGRVNGHAERDQEHLASFFGALNLEKLLASVKPWERVFRAVEGGKQQFVPVTCYRDNRVTTGLRLAVTDEDLLRSQPVDLHDELALIALHGGHRIRHVVDHRAQICDLFFDHLGFGRWQGHGFGWWCGHCEQGGKGEISCAAAV